MSTAVDARDEGTDLVALAARATAAHRAVGRQMRGALRSAVEAGEVLNEAKAQLPHGEWIRWVEQTAGIPRRTATHYRRIASKRANVAHLLDDGTVTEALAVLTGEKTAVEKTAEKEEEEEEEEDELTLWEKKAQQWRDWQRAVPYVPAHIPKHQEERHLSAQERQEKRYQEAQERDRAWLSRRALALIDETVDGVVGDLDGDDQAELREARDVIRKLLTEC